MLKKAYPKPAARMATKPHTEPTMRAVLEPPPDEDDEVGEPVGAMLAPVEERFMEDGVL